MRLWSSNETTASAPPNPAVIHDVEHVQILRLLVADTYRWKQDWASWRISFAHDAEEPGMPFAAITSFVRDQVAPICQRGCEAIDNVLYLCDENDLKLVFDVYGGVLRGAGTITSIQSQAAYGEAVRIAGKLAGARASARVSEPEASAPVDEIGELPDMNWEVIGHGLHRVATCVVQGHQVRVRLGYVGNAEMWLVDVDHKPDCIHFRSRADALSKMGIKMALKAFEGTVGLARR